MNVNKFSRISAVAIFASSLSFMALAVQNLDAHGQTKVNNAMAKKWATSDGKGANPAQQNTVVNVGSKRNGGCNLNVGTVDPKASKGGKQPKEIVVATKEIINVCK
jgi:hypothetical protein